MSRKSRTTVGVVEKLIEQRRLFEEWLQKLDADVEGMPKHVVERVRNDYQARLTEVIGELAEHEDGLRLAMAEAQARHDGLEAEQTARKDELAELRLRRHVGEVDDGRFKENNVRLKQTLDEMGKELAVSLRDIERYEEILDLIAQRPGAAAAEPAVEEAEEDEEPEEEARPVAAAPAAKAQAAEPPAKARAAEPAPKPAAKAEPPNEPVPAKAPARPSDAGMDELAFLRAVTGAKGGAAATAAPAEKVAARAAPPETAAPAAPQRAAPEAAEKPFSILKPEEPQIRDDATPARTSSGKPTVRHGNTLVCGECGAANLPTEWYCEKCGAELSAA